MCKYKILIKFFEITFFSTIVLLTNDFQTVQAVSSSQDKMVLKHRAKIDDYPDNTSDETVVDFPDANLKATVKKALQIPETQAITVGDIRKAPKNLTVDTGETPVKDLTGMKAFKYLPVGNDFKLRVSFGTNIVDFSQLQGVNYRSLRLNGDFKKQDVSKLLPIATANILQVQLVGNDYQSNFMGLQNNQLKILGPWLTAIYNNNSVRSSGDLKYIGLGNNNLTDFSPLSGIDRHKFGWIIALGNLGIDADPVYIVNQDTNVISAKPVLDIDGKRSDDYNATYDILSDDGQNYKSRKLKHLSDGMYQYDPISVRPGSNFITYGHFGFMYDTNNKNNSYLLINYGDKPDSGPVLKYDVMNYRQIILQNHPTVTLQFIDENGKVLKQPVILGAGKKIGDAFNLKDYINIKGYGLVSPEKLTGTYTQNPQKVTLVYKVKVNNSGNNTGTNVDRVFKDTKQTIATFADEPPVDVFDINGNRDVTVKLPTDSSWYSDRTMVLNGVNYFRVSAGWVKASDVYNYIPQKGFVRTRSGYGGKSLINAHNQLVGNRALAAKSDWLFDRKVVFGDKTYYRVSTNEFVESKDVLEYEPLSTTFLTTKQISLYDENEKLSNRALAASTSWFVDRAIKLGQEKYLRVETDEYVKAKDVLTKF